MNGVLRPKQAWALAIGCLALYLPVRIGSFMTGIFGGGPPRDRATLILGIAAIVTLFVLHGLSVWGDQGVRTVRRLLLGQAAFTFLPYAVIGPSWAPVGGLLAAAIVLTRPGARAWALAFAVVVAETAVAAVVLPDPELWLIAFRLQSPVILALLLFAVERLAMVVAELHAERERLAQAEVVRYRSTAADGLWAAIGEHLATIIATTRRPTPTDPSTSPQALARVADRARSAMEGVRRIGDLQAVAAADVPETAPAVDRDGTAWLLGRRVVLVAVVAFSGTFLNNLWADGIDDPTVWSLAVAACVVVGWAHVHHAAPRADGDVPDRWPLTLAVQIAVSVAAMAYFGMNANPLPVLTIGAVLVRLRAPWSLVVAVAATVALAVAGQPAVDQVGWHLYRVAITLGSAVAFYALCRFPDVARELHATRRSVAAVAVSRDRRRITRDVHDLLGSRLSAISLRAETAGRRAGGDPTAAFGELAELAETALADLRALAAASPELTLEEETATAIDLLAAAGIAASVDGIADAAPPAEVDALLAVVLREAVTNVVRHASPRAVTIRFTHDRGVARLEVHDDGRPRRDDPAAERRAGTGLANLTARVAEAGGRLITIRDAGGFTLDARIPADAERTRRRGAEAFTGSDGAPALR